MKKFLITLPVVAFALLSITACEDAKNQQGPIDVPEDINDSSLTPGEHKSKLEDIAIEFTNYFNPADTETIVYSILSLVEYLEYGDFPEYYSAMASNIARGAETLSPDQIMQLATRMSSDFVIDINDADTNPFAGKCYTFDGEEWIESATAQKSVKLVWDDSSLELSWDNTTKWEYNFVEEDMNIVVYVPKSIKLTMVINGKEHLGVEVKTSITDNYTIALSVSATLNGGYAIACDSKADNKGLEGRAAVKKGNKALLSSAMVVAINDFTDIDNWMVEYYDSWEETTYTYIDPYYYFVENVKNGSAQVDILNLSVIAQGDFKGMYEKIEEYDDMYDSWEDGDYDEATDKKYCEKVCELVNDNVDVVVIYNDTKEKVADVVMHVAFETWDGDKYYYVEPVLLFPDGSKFAFEDYFTERAFGNLIDALEDLADKFYDVVNW